MTGFILSALMQRHDVSAFSSGNQTLDNWLKNQALRAQNSQIAAVSVWTPESESQRVVAFFAIAPTVVTSENLSRRFSAGFSVIPAWLLGRLALDLSLQGGGLGKSLLRDALETIIAAAQKGGGRLIVVDPIDQRAAERYAKYGFNSVSTVSGQTPARAYITVADAAKSLQLDGS